MYTLLQTGRSRNETRLDDWILPVYLIRIATIGPGIYSASKINQYQKKEECFWRVERAGCLSLLTSLLSVILLSRQSDIFNISRHYEPSRLLWRYKFQMWFQKHCLIKYLITSVYRIMHKLVLNFLLLSRMQSSGILRRVTLVRTHVRRNLAPPSSGRKESVNLEITLAVTSNRRTLRRNTNSCF
jgi:hypothetical protein